MLRLGAHVSQSRLGAAFTGDVITGLDSLGFFVGEAPHGSPSFPCFCGKSFDPKTRLLGHSH